MTWRPVAVFYKAATLASAAEDVLYISMAAPLCTSHKPVGTEGQTVTHYGLTFGADRGLQLLASSQTWQKFYSGVCS